VIDMRHVMVQVMTGELASEELPMIAADALVEGQDTPALRQLAGLSRSDYREARELLGQVLDELRLSAPQNKEQAHWELTRWYAERIVSGAMEPTAGAHAIAWHAGALMFPDALATLAILADLWEDGAYDRAQLERDIIREAQLVLTPEER
jgi:hypothetical protein